MSPPTDNAPRTPDRRSSTQALFTAFRTLTSGRLKSPTPPPSTSSATCTPARSSSLASGRAGSVASPYSADDTLQRISQISQRSGQLTTGGPTGLDVLVAQLGCDHAFPERAAAIDTLCGILTEYPLHNILGLWSVASDLLLPEQPDEVAEAGYKLLQSCASMNKLTTIERNVFFDAASLRKNDRYFGKRLQVVAALTKGGRDIEACESSIVPFIITSLDACFKASLESSNTNRKANGKRNVDKPTQENLNLARLFEFANDVCKFNARILTDDDLETLLRQAMAICQETTQASDMENAIRLFDTIITYLHVPKGVLKLCVEVLCAIHRQIAPLQEQTWNTLSNLFKSHVGGAAISSLLHTLLEGPTRKERQHSMFRGTLQVIQALLVEDGRSGLPKVPMSLLFPALKASIKEPHQSHEEFVINLIDVILSKDNLRELLLNETDLGDLIEVIATCAERNDNRHRAKGIGTTGSSTNLRKGLSDRDDVTSEPGPLETGKPLLSIHSSDYTYAEEGLIRSVSADSLSHLSSTNVLSTKVDFTRRSSDNLFYRVLLKLHQMNGILDFVQKEAVMGLFLNLSHRLEDSACEKMIQHFANECLLNPSNGEWLNVCRVIVDRILKDSTRPRSLRIIAIQSLRETYDTVDKLCASDLVLQCRDLILDNVQTENDVEILNELVDFAVSVADRAHFDEFADIVAILTNCLDRPRTSTAATTASWSSNPFVAKGDVRFGTPANVIATAFVRLFTRSIVNSARKTRMLYETLRAISGNDKYDNDARLTALKLLFRLRADSRYALTVSSSSEGERIAAELCRTEETAILPEKVEDALHVEQGRSEDSSSSWRDQRKPSGSSPHASLNRHASRPTAAAGRVSRPIPPLWMYPGPKGLPEEPSSTASRVCFSHIDASEYPLSQDILDMEVTLWLELIISLLQKPPDWEIYSYVLVHLGPQLSNQALVRSCVVQLRMMRNVLCEQVRNSSFHEPPPHTLLKRADVAVCLFHVLTVIISYHDYFEKSEEDDLVKAFLQGITQWDRTSKWCIHALSVCCFEIPLSVSKSLDSIVQKMSQIITKPATAIHILEFLISLARLPELYKNFREDEFKLVFGVCFRYLQHIRDQRDRAAHTTSSQSGLRTLRPSGVSREFTASPIQNPKQTKLIEDDMPQYLYSLAYHVITFWFMALKMEDRPKQIPWITKNLYYTDSTGRSIMEEQGEVIMDIMNMVAYTDRDQTVREENFAKPGDGEIWKKTWIVGNSFVTLETAARTGVSLVTTRRPVSSIMPLLHFLFTNI